MTDHEAIAFEVKRRLEEQQPSSFDQHAFDRRALMAAALGALCGLLLLAMLLLLRASGPGLRSSEAQPHESPSEDVTQDWGAGGRLLRPDFSAVIRG